MADIEKLEKQAEADKKEIVEYKQMYEQLNKKARLLYEENKSVKKLAKLPLDDKFARKVAKKQGGGETPSKEKSILVEQKY